MSEIITDMRVVTISVGNLDAGDYETVFFPKNVEWLKLLDTLN